MNEKVKAVSMQSLQFSDPEIAIILDEEKKRQQDSLNLIASENMVSGAVLEAQGSVLTNKYAEGYPDARYYGGCFFVDHAEKLAISRAKELFAAGHVNVQPHSGTSANIAAYLALLNPGDRIMGMNLSHGGHLTHGSKINISGSHFHSFSYGVDRDTFLLNIDQVSEKALEVKPKLIIAGASAYPRLIDFEGFKEIADDLGAYLLVDIAHTAGFIAAGLHPNPVPVADIVTATTHKTLRGPRGGMILCQDKYASVIDKAVFPGMQGGPLMHIIAAKAVAFKEAKSPGFITYLEFVLANAKALARALTDLGYDLVTGGTDTHQVLVDLSNKNVSGLEAETLLDRLNICVNKNAIPYDKKGANDPSGMRLGTPTLTSRGMGPDQMEEIASLIDQALAGRHNPKKLEIIKQRVGSLCQEFPAYSK